MRYLLLIYGDQERYSRMSDEESQADLQRWFEYDADIKASGASPGGAALQPTTTATSVRDEGGNPVVTDGPFAETREQLGGFIEIDVASLEEAVGWAERCPAVGHGCVEVRPVAAM